MLLYYCAGAAAALPVLECGVCMLLCSLSDVSRRHLSVLVIFFHVMSLKCVATSSLLIIHRACFKAASGGSTRHGWQRVALRRHQSSYSLSNPYYCSSFILVYRTDFHPPSDKTQQRSSSCDACRPSIRQQAPCLPRRHAFNSRRRVSLANLTGALLRCDFIRP